MECKGLYFSEDDTYKEIAYFNEERFRTGFALYEVIRIHEGVCLFLEDHVQRLQLSVNLSGYKYPISYSHVSKVLSGLVKHNGFLSGNIKITLQFSEYVKPVLYAYFIPHSYPTPAMYKKGVSTALFKATRSNPNVKRSVPEFRKHMLSLIESEKIYEALLFTENETITEGSKSNIFFVKSNTIYTAPGDSVLKGITRGKVIELCNQLNYKVIELPISIDSLNNFEAAFLTGTSPKILPISNIDKIAFRMPNPVISKLSEDYDKIIAEYISRKKNIL